MIKQFWWTLVGLLGLCCLTALCPQATPSVTVYVFDGGISTTHPEIAGKVRIGYTAFPDDPLVCNSHGTAVAGAIAGSMLGMAPQAHIVDIKMVNCAKLRGTLKAIVDGAQWAIQDHRMHPGPAVANWSFVVDSTSDIPIIDSTVAELRAANIPVIVAAGNLETDACHVSPANAKGAIVVSSIAADDSTDIERASGAAYGHCVDFYARGMNVFLPALDHDAQPIYEPWTGTSMATAFVSGYAARYLAQYPNATPDQVLVGLRAEAQHDVVRDTRSAHSFLLR